MTAAQYRVLGRMISGNRLSLAQDGSCPRLSDGTPVAASTFKVLLREQWITPWNERKANTPYYTISRLGREAFWFWVSEERKLRCPYDTQA